MVRAEMYSVTGKIMAKIAKPFLGFFGIVSSMLHVSCFGKTVHLHELE